MKFKPDTVIFLGWNSIPDFSKKKSNDNYIFSKILFDKLLRLKSIKKIIASGSCYELEPNIKTKHFVKAKLKLKNYLLKKCNSKNINFFWLRIFYAYGPYQSKDSLISSLYNGFLLKKKIILQNPFLANDFIYIENVVQKILFVVQNKKLTTNTFNIGSGKLTFVKDIMLHVKKILDNKFKYKKILIKSTKQKNKIIKTLLINNNQKDIDTHLGIFKTLKHLKNKQLA